MNLNKRHPLYQEDINNVLSSVDTQQLQGKSFLITGATGMVGVMLIDVLMSIQDVKIYAVGRNKDKVKYRLGEYLSDPRFSFIEQDVRSPFSEYIKVDYIIPMASFTHPLAYSQYPIETLLINIQGAINALNLAVKNGATVLYTSSNEIYGNAIADEEFKEEYNGRLDLSNARSCYNESKRTSESLCQSFIAEKGVKVKIVRLCRIFGPTMLESDTKASSQFIKKAIAEEDIVLKSEGNQYFSYTYVADAIYGLLTVLLKGEIGVAYNVSSEKTNVHLGDFAKICADCCNKNVVFDLPSVVERKGFSTATHAILSNSRIKQLGFKPIYSIKDAIVRTVRILKNN